MNRTFRRSLGARARLAALAAAASLGAAAPALADYHPIKATMADRTVTLTGHDLTVDQVVAIARHGAKVALSPEALQRNADTSPPPSWRTRTPPAPSWWCAPTR